MRYLFPLVAALMFSVCAEAQQGVQYTQFMFNKLGFNPAYAGSQEVPCLSCIHRSQWVGFEGAPTSQAFNFHAPLFGKKVGLGLSLQRDKIGPTTSYWINLAYAYRMDIGPGKLSIGLQGSMRSYQIDFDDTEAVIKNDLAVQEGYAQKELPNFGMGIYYLSDFFYAGYSIPYILSGDISLYEAIANNSDFAVEEAHHYFMAGLRVDLGEKVKYKPGALVKHTKGTPFDLDLNSTFVFLDRFGVGVTYRLGGIRNSIGESFDFLAFFQTESGFRIGLAYDYSLSEVRTHQSGTFEIMLEKCLKGKTDRLTNPRFFF